jgi:hypothetical protein
MPSLSELGEIILILLQIWYDQLLVKLLICYTLVIRSSSYLLNTTGLLETGITIWLFY